MGCITYLRVWSGKLETGHYAESVGRQDRIFAALAHSAPAEAADTNTVSSQHLRPETSAGLIHDVAVRLK